MFFVPLNEFGIQFCPYARLGANTMGCVRRSCLLFLRLQGCWGSFLKLTYMLINKYVNFRKLYSAPLAIKSERQLDFSQPIVLALGSTDSIT